MPPAFGWENDEIQSLLKKSRREMNEARRIEMINNPARRVGVRIEKAPPSKRIIL
jgi:hypothetical protein